MTNTTTEQQTITVPMDKYAEIGGKISCQPIGDNGTCKTFWWLGRQYVATGGIYKGGKCLQVGAYQVVPLAAYRGTLPALPYHKHNAEIDADLRPRGYAGMIVKDSGTPLVIVGPEIQFVGIVAIHQTNLFDPLEP